jgi:hypothetical protein
MTIAIDYCYEFDLHEDEDRPTLDAFRERMAERGRRGWEFAGSVTLDVGGPREVTVWRQLA